jgi:hypothetical protein
MMEATMSRHLTPDEIALNQQEAICRDEIEKLEMQEAQLDLELEQDIGESGKMLVMYTLQALHKELLAKHRELEHIKNMQITSVQRTLRGYGAD